MIGGRIGMRVVVLFLLQGIRFRCRVKCRGGWTAVT